MENQGTMKVEDALMIIADNLENVMIPSGMTAREAVALVQTLTGSAQSLRACSEALRNAAAKKAEAEEPEEPTSEGLFEESEE